jgi:predicted transcriptional regulator
LSTKGEQKKKPKRRTWSMPQEIEVWYVLPAIRRELARIMIAREIQQKQIAKMLGVTEPAVTQYKLKKSKRSRGDQIQIPPELMSDLEASADLIVKSWNETKEESSVYEIMTREFNRLIEVLRDAGVLCDIHREHCIHVKEDCAACD